MEAVASVLSLVLSLLSTAITFVLAYMFWKFWTSHTRRAVMALERQAEETHHIKFFVEKLLTQHNETLFAINDNVVELSVLLSGKKEQ